MKHIDFYIKIIVVVPFIGYDSKWPDQSKHRLKKLIQNANDSIVISHSADVSSYKKRNYYMVDHAEYLIGVFDNQKKLRSGTAQTVNYALHQGKVITLIHPDTMETEVIEFSHVSFQPVCKFFNLLFKFIFFFFLLAEERSF